MLSFKQYTEQQLQEGKKSASAAMALATLAAGTAGFQATLHHLNNKEKKQQEIHQSILDYIKSPEGKKTERPSELDPDEMGSGVVSQTYPKKMIDHSRIKQLKPKNIEQFKTPSIHPKAEAAARMTNDSFPTTKGKFALNRPVMPKDDPIADLIRRTK